MGRKRSKKGGGGLRLFPIIVLLLAAAAGLAYVYYQKQQAQRNPPALAENAAELVSEERIVYGGMPRVRPGPDGAAGSESMRIEVLKNKRYVVGYSEERRDPLWVTYRVIHNPQPYSSPRPSGFLRDTRSAAAVKETDFTHSGYERGHMAPNSAIARCYGPEAQVETFLLTNICPQSPALNEKVWERLEVDERRYADRFEEVWVIDGPIFGDRNAKWGGKTGHLASGIAVPEAFYKILIDEEGGVGGRPRIFSVIMPQTVKGTELPQQFLTSVREIEDETGLDFFWKIEAETQEQLESKVWPMWQ